MTIGRSIDLALVEHLGGTSTTVWRCMKITPAGLSPFGITTGDRDVLFDDGFGPLWYRARRGYTASAQVGSADLSVENSEAEALLAEYPLEQDGVTLEMVRTGILDGARFVEYLINYLADDNGKAILASGTIGEIRSDKGLRAFIERRSLTQTLKQKSIIEAGSVDCRAKFGDERCKFPVDTLWDSGVVDTVGAEADLTFSFAPSSGAIAEDGYYSPGVVYWTTGANAGRTHEIDTFTIDSSGAATVTLVHAAQDLIAANDHFDIRPDCDYTWGPDGIDLQGTRNNCLYYNNRANFRGEPKRPVADSAVLGVPGGPGGGTGGTGSTQVIGAE